MQFKLRTLFAIVSLCCIYCGIVFGLPPAASLIALCLLTVSMPSLIVGGIIYARGAARAFWIGCAASGFIPFLVSAYLGFAIAVAVFDESGDGEEARWYLFAIAICHSLVALQGLIVVGSRWLHSPRRTANTAIPLEGAYQVLHNRISLGAITPATPVPDDA